MSGLPLDKKLLSSKEGDSIRAVARTATLTVLRRLDGDRKEEVVHSLTEAELLIRDCTGLGNGLRPGEAIFGPG
jgi:hypothetical protein